MNFKHFSFSLLIFIGWFSLVSWIYFCHIAGSCGGSSIDETPKVVTIDSVPKIKDTVVKKEPPKKTILDLPIPITKNIGKVYLTKKLIDSIHQYLLKDFRKELIIEGLYSNSELVGIGDKRAENTEKIILWKSILNNNRVSKRSKLSDFQFNEKNQFEKGVLLVVRNMNEQQFDSLKQRIEHKTINIKFSSSRFTPNNDFISYTKVLKAYIDCFPNKKIKIIGHTDNVGEVIDNEWFGMERAKAIKQYLIRIGFTPDKITPFSMGESKPIFDNSTWEGREKNRRIEIELYD